MRFGKWYPLAEAAGNAPSTPGVFQVRVASGLIQYPTGKSAMVHYAAAENLLAEVEAFAAKHPGETWLCRHSIEFTPTATKTPQVECDRLLQRFTQQFGTAPTAVRGT